MLPSTNRTGHKTFNLVIGVRVPLGVPNAARNIVSLAVYLETMTMCERHFGDGDIVNIDSNHHYIAEYSKGNLSAS